MRLSDRIGWIKPSATLAVAARAAEMRRSGVDIISLTLGEPDFPSVNEVTSEVGAAKWGLSANERVTFLLGGTSASLTSP